MKLSTQLMQRLLGAIEFISEGAMEIFSNTDNYPEVGFQPYDGEVFSQWIESQQLKAES